MNFSIVKGRIGGKRRNFNRNFFALSADLRHRIATLVQRHRAYLAKTDYTLTCPQTQSVGLVASICLDWFYKGTVHPN